MNLESRYRAFVLLGQQIQAYLCGKDNAGLDKAMRLAKAENSWFTESNVRLALSSLVQMCSPDELMTWLSAYPGIKDERMPKTVAVVMPGNIPLVGFHDFLCVLLSGHQILIKLSSKDRRLLSFVAQLLIEIEPRFAEHISFEEHIIKGFDAVIATGGQQANTYFQTYFCKYPHIIRGHRNSCAILTGEETEEQLALLFEDMFLYFGLGCRNVSKIYIPENYDFEKIIQAAKTQTMLTEELRQHHPYQNNYQYQKMILMINQQLFCDAETFLLVEKPDLQVPISVIHYAYYDALEKLKTDLNTRKDQIQCIVSADSMPFGQAQHPALWDYADGLDTLSFCLDL